MNDPMNEWTQFSPFAGRLYLQAVSGKASNKREPENDVHAVDGADRSMFAYAPVSGCPDAKQGQILMVLRGDASQESAQMLLETLGLRELAEREHILILFPNPQKTGWNYEENPAYDCDTDFLQRCFGSLRTSDLQVNGFNGMIFYVAACEAASALCMTAARRMPASISAMMLGPFPDGYAMARDGENVQVAAWVANNPAAEHYLKSVNGVSTEEYRNGAMHYYGSNPNCRLIVSKDGLSKRTVHECYEMLFSLTRRWQNDVYGTYQKRTCFTQRGFVAHVKDTSLGVNNGFAHTWYTYIPPQLRGTSEKVPLVFYFHSVNCVPLYGAEQSQWHEIADRDNFIVVYPAPAVGKAWNIFEDPSLPSDFAFIMALVEHMKTVHPIDESRIYASGFSMGSMMTHAITAVYPEVFAAAAACNAVDFGYFKKPKEMYTGLVKGVDVNSMADFSTQRKLADAKRAVYPFRMPMFLNMGYDDSLVNWPVTQQTQDVRMDTLRRWFAINNIPTENMLDETTLSGLAADESFYEKQNGRLFHQRWRSRDAGSPVLYEMILCKQMPHAILPEQIALAWEFIRDFSRNKDGSLNINQQR